MPALSAANGATRLLAGLGLVIAGSALRAQGSARQGRQLDQITFRTRPDRGAIFFPGVSGNEIRLLIPGAPQGEIAVFQKGLEVYVVLIQPNGGLEFRAFRQYPASLEMEPTLEASASLLPGQIERIFGPDGLPDSRYAILKHFLENLAQ